jgi:hypothetical protein
MTKLLMIVAIIGIAYWYWSGSHQKSTEALEAERLQDNAVIMQRCIKEEERMQAAGGVAGVGDVGSTGADAERVCAAKNNLRLQDGKWYSTRD